MPMEYINKYFVTAVMFVSLTSAILSCGENELKDYSAAILVKDSYVQMKLYGTYNADRQWDKVTGEILDRVIAVHSPKKILIVAKGGDEEPMVTNRIVEKVSIYLIQGGCDIEVRDKR